VQFTPEPFSEQVFSFIGLAKNPAEHLPGFFLQKISRKTVHKLEGLLEILEESASPDFLHFRKESGSIPGVALEIPSSKTYPGKVALPENGQKQV